MRSQGFSAAGQEMSFHQPGKSDQFSRKVTCKKNQNKKVKFWEANKAAAYSTTISRSPSFIRLHFKSSTSHENMKFTSSHKDSAHLPSAGLVFLRHRTMNVQTSRWRLPFFSKASQHPLCESWKAFRKLKWHGSSLGEKGGRFRVLLIGEETYIIAELQADYGKRVFHSLSSVWSTPALSTRSSDRWKESS